MANELPVSRVVNVSINLQPLAAARRNFGLLCIVGSDDVIDPLERIRSYSTIDGIVSDFGVDSDVYRAATLFFSQIPRPSVLKVGRWAQEDSPAYLKGGILAGEDTNISSWNSISDGSFGLVINGSAVSITGLDFSTALNMNGVATEISNALSEHGASCVWTGDSFVFATLNTGSDQEIGYGSAVGSGTDISTKMAITETLALPLVPGMTAETALECAAALADVGGWYGLAFADTLTDEDHLAVSGFVEARTALYFVTTTNSNVLSSTMTTDLASQLKDLKRQRTYCQYSKNPWAAISAAGRAFTVNFNANRSTITLKFKQQPSIIAEGLTESQANTLAAKNCNVFVAYDNDTAIIQEGVVSSGAFFDEIHGTDWLQNAVQAELYNLLYQSKTKIPQTDDGMNQLITAVNSVMAEAVNNGLIAPGVWNADGFGGLNRGDYLPEGYYTYAPSVDDQPQSEREQRKSTVIQVAAKLAGAIHFVDVQIDINR